MWSKHTEHISCIFGSSDFASDKNKIIVLHRALIVDIGANLTDSMYQGVYHGSQKHQPDLDKVLERSWKNNLSKIIITAGNVEESKKALEIARIDGKYS